MLFHFFFFFFLRWRYIKKLTLIYVIVVMHYFWGYFFCNRLPSFDYSRRQFWHWGYHTAVRKSLSLSMKKLFSVMQKIKKTQMKTDKDEKLMKCSFNAVHNCNICIIAFSLLFEKTLDSANLLLNYCWVDLVK